MKRIIPIIIILILATLACEESVPSTPFPTPEKTSFDGAETSYGFFPSPPEITLESVLKHYEDMGEYGDFVLFQHPIPWDDFVESVDGESQKRTDIRNQMTLARQNGLDSIFIVDSLNGLNRREFMELPSGWDASFANSDVRAAFKNYTLWVLREFHPQYLGLGSEVNSYLDAYPEDAKNYISLYNEVYALIKAEAPETQVFATFQWEDLNNLGVFPTEGRKAYDTNWEQIEAFEPNLDIWAISSYPFIVFSDGSEIPTDYYTPLLTQTSKAIAVAEGGFPSLEQGNFGGNEESQVAYLNAINDQLGGERLSFWVHLLLNDFNLDSYATIMGQDHRDLGTLSLFASMGLREFDGTPKPALEKWIEIQNR
ncbi:MAG: hypothetical protein HN392_11560 [Anaerolineae bacterium]|jgi:hypothetical protein|nr:hypothetical protein [Anaerolineae bacterium]MBT7075509.1 hypothetical protein [Anaerolineae bacterium]MBT7782006.1 hypothetical protein [Anaerolineae bacterium]